MGKNTPFATPTSEGGGEKILISISVVSSSETKKEERERGRGREGAMQSAERNIRRRGGKNACVSSTKRREGGKVDSTWLLNSES